MKRLSMTEAKANLAQLVDEVAAGQPVIITKSGRDVVQLIPVQPASRRFDFLAGAFEVPDDFDRTGADEIIEMFYGKDAGPTEPPA